MFGKGKSEILNLYIGSYHSLDTDAFILKMDYEGAVSTMKFMKRSHTPSSAS